MQASLRTICLLNFLFCFIGLVGQSELLESSSETVDSISNAEQLLEEAEKLNSEKKYLEAVEKYDEASIAFAKAGDVEQFEAISQNIYRLCMRNAPIKHFPLYEKKIKFCEEQYGKRSGQAGLWNLYKGILHLKCQQLNSANEFLNIAEDIFLELKDRPKDLYRVYFMKGTYHLRAFQSNEAIEQYNYGLSLLEEMKEKELISDDFFGKEQSTITLNLGIIYKNIEENEKGIEYLSKVIPYLQETNNLTLLAVVYFNLGHIHFKNFDLQTAREFMQKSIYNRGQVFGENHPSLGESYNFLALIERSLGNYEEAIVHFNKALDLNQKAYGVESPSYQRASQNLASTFKKLGNFAEAEKIQREGLRILEATSDTPKRNLAYANAALAEIWIEQNIKLDSAIILLEKSVAISKEIFGDRNPLTAQMLNHLSVTYLTKEDYNTALDYAQKALVANSSNFNDVSHFNQNPKPEDLLDKKSGLSAVRNKNRSLYMIWENDKNSPELVEQIQNCLNLVVDLSKDIFKDIGDQQGPDPTYHIASKKALSDCIRINYGLYQYSKDENYIEDYFINMDLIKSQQLLMANQKQKALKSLKIPSELIEEEKYLSGQIDSLEQLIYTASTTDDTISIEKTQNEYLFEAKRNLETFIAELENEHPKYHQLKYDFEPVPLDELKGYLDDKTLYVEFSTDDNDGKDKKNLHFLALSHKEVHVLHTFLDADFGYKITAFNKLLRSHNILRADRRRKFINLSHELYQQFLQPIEHLLEGKERLVIVGEDVTHYLPFEALLKSKEDKPWHELDFLIRNHEISYHYSGTLFARAQSQKKEFDNELLAFAPVFSDGNNALASLRAEGLMMADSTFRSVEGDNFSPLPHSEKEVQNIQKLFSDGSNVNVLLNEAANELNLKSALEQNHRFVHIASHSFANIDYPKFSGIACMESMLENEKEDGILYVGEIYNLAVDSDLVVLSSCESGLGKLLGGEGMLGLNRSFVYAGVPNVIFSLWKVYDEATGEMMTEFYKNTLSGETYSQALRNAKLKMLDNPETAAPDIWGAFLLIGR